MSKFSLLLTFALATLVGALEGHAQTSASAPPPRASLNLRTQISVGGAKVKVLRKRFYLFSGVKDKNRDPIDVNKDLIGRIRTAVVPSRDCFYCSQGASAAYIAWLQLKDCETPYCREITADDVQKVPEFADAYKQALVKYKNKPDIARLWLTPFLPAGRRDGFYLQRRQVVMSTLGGVTPLATVMTDPNQGQANFIDIDLTGLAKEEKKDGKDVPANTPPTQPFLFSNVVPIEVSGKFFTWICQVNLKPGANTITLPAASNGSCEVIIKDVPKCAGGACKQ